MDFTLTEEQQMIVDSLGKYAIKELKPIALEYRDRLIPMEKMRDIQLDDLMVRSIFFYFFFPSSPNHLELK